MKKMITTIMAMAVMFGYTGCVDERVKPEDVRIRHNTIFVEHMGHETKSYLAEGLIYDDITNSEYLTHHKWETKFAYSIVKKANDYVKENNPYIEYYITIVVPDEETLTIMESANHSTHVDIKIDTICYE